MLGCLAFPYANAADVNRAPVAQERTELSLSLATPPEPTSADVDRLGNVLQQVWTRNPRVLQAESTAAAAGYDISAARTGYYPFLAVDSNQATRNASSTSVSIVQPLWNGGLTGAQVEAAKVQQSLTLVALNQARLELGLQTVQAYLAIALAEEQRFVWSEYIQGLESLLEVISRRADKGASPPVDVETATSRLRQAEAGLAATQSALLANRSQLTSLLNHPPGKITWPRAGLAMSPAEVERIIADQAFATHPTTQQARYEIDLAQARTDISKAALWPQVNLQHSQLVQQESGDFTPDSSTQLVLQYQTDSGLRGYRGAQAQAQRVVAARNGLEFAKLDIANRIRSARVTRDAAAAQFTAQKASAESAVTLVDSFLRQFKAGRKSWLEVLNARQEANQALLQVSAIKNTYWLANAQIALEGMAWKKLSPNAPPIIIERRKR